MRFWEVCASWSTEPRLKHWNSPVGAMSIVVKGWGEAGWEEECSGGEQQGGEEEGGEGGEDERPQGEKQQEQQGKKQQVPEFLSLILALPKCATLLESYMGVEAKNVGDFFPSIWWSKSPFCQSCSFLFHKRSLEHLSLLSIIENMKSESELINRIFGHPPASKKRGEIFVKLFFQTLDAIFSY